VYAAILVVAGLGLLEGGARLVAPPPENARYASAARLDASIGFESLNQTLVPDDRMFWSLRPSMPPTVIEGRIGPIDKLRFTVSTTASGWRTTPPAPDARRTVVAIGDSCTFGIGVDDAQAYPALLQQLMPGTRCINAGVPGYTAFQGRRVLEAHLAAWHPDAVTIAFGFNDIADWDAHSDLEHAASVPVTLGPFERSRLVQLARHAVATAKRKDEPPPDPSTRRPRLNTTEFADELRAIIRLCRDAGATPVLIAWPARYEVEGRMMIPHHDVVRAVAASEGVTLVDPLTTFRTLGGTALFVDVIHANPVGNRIVAELVKQALGPGFAGGG
jgi:lysophospholipase L1-like esterase